MNHHIVDLLSYHFFFLLKRHYLQITFYLQIPYLQITSFNIKCIIILTQNLGLNYTWNLLLNKLVVLKILLFYVSFMHVLVGG